MGCFNLRIQPAGQSIKTVLASGTQPTAEVSQAYVAPSAVVKRKEYGVASAHYELRGENAALILSLCGREDNNVFTLNEQWNFGTVSNTPVVFKVAHLDGDTAKPVVLYRQNSSAGLLPIGLGGSSGNVLETVAGSIEPITFDYVTDEVFVQPMADVSPAFTPVVASLSAASAPVAVVKHVCEFNGEDGGDDDQPVTPPEQPTRGKNYVYGYVTIPEDENVYDSHDELAAAFKAHLSDAVVSQSDTFSQHIVNLPSSGLAFVMVADSENKAVAYIDGTGTKQSILQGKAQFAGVQVEYQGRYYVAFGLRKVSAEAVTFTVR